MPNLGVRAHGTVMVMVVNESSPGDAEWTAAVELGRKMLAAVDGDASRTGAVVFSAGGTPTSLQRQKLRELYGDKPPPLALVTDSVVARGTAAVFKVFWPSQNAVFSPADWQQALRHAGLTADSDGHVRGLLRELQAEVGGKPLRVLEAALRG